jgi:hypothetical protein
MDSNRPSATDARTAAPRQAHVEALWRLSAPELAKLSKSKEVSAKEAATVVRRGVPTPIGTASL